MTLKGSDISKRPEAALIVGGKSQVIRMLRRGFQELGFEKA